MYFAAIALAVILSLITRGDLSPRVRSNPHNSSNSKKNKQNLSPQCKQNCTIGNKQFRETAKSFEWRDCDDHSSCHWLVLSGICLDLVLSEKLFCVDANKKKLKILWFHSTLFSLLSPESWGNFCRPSPEKASWGFCPSSNQSLDLIWGNNLVYSSSSFSLCLTTYTSHLMQRFRRWKSRNGLFYEIWGWLRSGEKYVVCGSQQMVIDVNCSSLTLESCTIRLD